MYKERIIIIIISVSYFKWKGEEVLFALCYGLLIIFHCERKQLLYFVTYFLSLK